MTSTLCRRHDWQQSVLPCDRLLKMVLFCLLIFVEISAFWVSSTFASSSLTDTLIFRHGRSRVRHSSEKNHIRWGLKAFDNLTLIDYDYENSSNSSNGSNETMFDGVGMNTTNQSIFDNDGVGTFSLAYYSSSDRSTASGGGGWTKMSSTSSPSMTRQYNNNWTAGGWTTISSSANPNIKLAKKQIMENIRKDVEEGIVYLRTHAHLLQPTESMPSEKLQPLQLPPVPASQSTASPLNDVRIELTTEPILIEPGIQGTPSSFDLPTVAQYTSRNMRKRFQNHFNQVKGTADNIIQKANTFSLRNTDFDANKKADALSQSIAGTDAKTDVLTPPPSTDASLKNGKTSFDHVNDEKHNLNGNLLQSLSEKNATGDKFNINLNNKFEYNLQEHQLEALEGSFVPTILSPASPAPPTIYPPTKIYSLKNHSTEIERKEQNRQVNPPPVKFQSHTNDAVLNVEIIEDVAKEKDNNNGSDNLQSNSDGSGSAGDKVHLRILPNFNLYSSDDGNTVAVATVANDSEAAENEIIFPSDEDDVDDNDFERNINFDLTNDNLNDITPAIYRMDAIELAQMKEMDETSRRNRLRMMKGMDVVTEFLQIVERSMDNNCSAGTAVNLGEGVVDQYAQERFRVKADVAVNRANMLTR